MEFSKVHLLVNWMAIQTLYKYQSTWIKANMLYMNPKLLATTNYDNILKPWL